MNILRRIRGYLQRLPLKIFDSVQQGMMRRNINFTMRKELDAGVLSTPIDRLP